MSGFFGIASNRIFDPISIDTALGRIRMRHAITSPLRDQSMPAAVPWELFFPVRLANRELIHLRRFDPTSASNPALCLSSYPNLTDRPTIAREVHPWIQTPTTRSNAARGHHHKS
jgi:hypothetical protein